MAFFITHSQSLHFITVECLENRQVPTILKSLKTTIKLYQQRGFNTARILADPEFESLRADFPNFNTAAAGEHVPGIERTIRTVKDTVRSTYRMLPFRRVPRLMMNHLVRNSVFLLNAFPHQDGISSINSPRYFLFGQEVS